jgi:hypothetical protein
MKEGRLAQELSTDEVSHADVERIYLEHMHAGDQYVQNVA